MFTNYFVSLFIYICLFLTAFVASAEQIISLDNLPQPAPYSYFVTSAPLQDGTFLIWNGNQVFKQTTPRRDNFNLIASGYQGDPGFIAVSPDGKKAVLGQGYLGDLYLIDLTNPQNFTPSTIIGNISHYYGIFLTSQLLLLDITKPDFSGSEIHILPLSTKRAFHSQRILSKPKNTHKDMVIDKPPFAYSATLALANDEVYIMDGNTREIRKFNINDLINAYNSHQVLDWQNDGIQIGTPGIYFTGGVSGITVDGNLLIGGSEGFMLPGGIQEVNPITGEIIKVWDPANNQGYYSAFYNKFSDTILAIVNNTGYLINRSGMEECPDCTPKRKSIYCAGEDVCLDIFGENLPPNTTFTWSKEGEDLEDNPRVSGIHCRKLMIYNAQVQDSGIYICSFNSEKTIFKVRVTVTDQRVPISNTYLIICFGIILSLIGTLKIVKSL